MLHLNVRHRLCDIALSMREFKQRNCQHTLVQFRKSGKESFIHHRPESERYLNNFPCLHRYTRSSICAIRCDGRDDLCQGYADEVGCGRAAIETVAGYTIAALVALVMVLLCFDVMIPGWGDLVRGQIDDAGIEMKTVCLHMEQGIRESDSRNYKVGNG